ncbi:GGDEF domain-containing protein [Rhodoferax sp. U11-2br]|uniref:GGDEF domain-containing protein n=1 Tax=Rhodoferax sp. U11-2br TaxID=2838878 RepID=UPI001BEB786E|nr:GGDEF domain-containing protein [Rhodoferax sp. U11-2br]MBT3065660.1 GGDEF domain-containing protein [Rhodoferax sp. U11-2br]
MSSRRPQKPRPAAAKQLESLTQLMGHAEDVKTLMEEFAEGLSSVNLVLKQEHSAPNRQSSIDTAIQHSEILESKVQDATDKLALMNEALETEWQSRYDLEEQLAAVILDEAAARHASLHDPLTGLPNRSLFENRLTLGLAQAKRYDRALAVMFLDLNEFKQINDVYGHDVGDVVLQTIADRLKETTRQADTVSRLGGDEFVYLLAEFADLRDVLRVAQKIIQAIQIPCQLAQGVLVVQASIGIAIYPKHGESAQALLKSADHAMFKAKRSKSSYAFAG